MPSKDVKRYLENWQGEVDGQAIYRALAATEKNAKLSEVYTNLSHMEEKHRQFWEGYLQKNNVQIPKASPSWRTQTLIWLAQWFGPDMILSTVAGFEKADKNMYAPQVETKGTTMVADEHLHDRLLEEILEVDKKGVSGSYLAEIEGRHKGVAGNTLRAAVLGANDGLCSNLSLVMGVAGAAMSNHVLLLTGLAGLLAGACSMALGEWISVTSSKELNEREIKIEEEEYEMNPAGEKEELQLIYESKGMNSEAAKNLVEQMMNNKATAIDTLVREELGIDPNEKGGSPMIAAGSSFALFALGAIIPVCPFFFLSGNQAVIVSAGLSAVALFAFGAIGTLFTGKPVWFAGTRQLLLGLLAALVTYGLGHLLGVSLS